MFFYYAIKTPMHHTLYKEIFKSIGISTVASYSYVHYHRVKYHEAVNETYDKLKDRFASNPVLATIRED